MHRNTSQRLDVFSSVSGLKMSNCLFNIFNYFCEMIVSEVICSFCGCHGTAKYRESIREKGEAGVDYNRKYKSKSKQEKSAETLCGRSFQDAHLFSSDL